MSITTVLLDLDGVVRHFDPARVASIEQAHQLSAGSLTAAAFEPVLLKRVITGKISRASWVDEVGRRVANPTAAQRWMASRGTVDPAMLSAVDELRRHGTIVAVLTNGTDTIADEMQALGIADRFVKIFNSADIGFAKPDRRAFEHVCAELDVAPTAVFFTDDTPSKLAGAEEIGMTARVYQGIDQFYTDVRDVGIELGSRP